MAITEILDAMIRRDPPRSQREACALAARQSIATLGALRADRAIHDACSGLCAGLFGPAYNHGSIQERVRMLMLMEDEYRKAARAPEQSIDTGGRDGNV